MICFFIVINSRVLDSVLERWTLTMLHSPNYFE